INGLAYPRPVQLFIRGLPQAGDYLRASAQLPGNDDAELHYCWWLGKTADGPMAGLAEGDILALTPTMAGRFVRCQVKYGDMQLVSKAWQIQPEGSIPLENGESVNAGILRARGIITTESSGECITRFELAQMVIRLWGLQYQPASGLAIADVPADSVWYPGIDALIRRGMMALQQGQFLPDRPIRREEAATVAMMSCGVYYRNASTMLESTFTDGRILRDIYLTNAQRAVAFGFLSCDDEGRFRPRRYLRRHEALEMMLAISHFVGDQDVPGQRVNKLR
ncbi:MAG: S-layer homology domain-containing protein, partial [Kluyvera intermedia]